MKAILLAGGQGTRLRPLTLNTPKPVVPILGRPFLHYQIDLLKQVPEIDEVILSLNYQPDRIEAVLGDGSDVGLRIRYVVEPEPLGTGGAIKFAARGVTDAIVVFNGDVLTQIDLAAVVERHRSTGARATIVLTPVENPLAYGLVETDARGLVTRFLEKPTPDQVTTNRINAGVYVLEPGTFDRIPDGVNWSIERQYFPSLVDRGEPFAAFLYDGYWIDIGTPEKYAAVHRDIMDGRFLAPPFSTAGNGRAVVRSTAVHPDATLVGPCFIDHDVVVGAGATIGPHTVLGRGSSVGPGASIVRSVVWPDSRVGDRATIDDSLIGRHCQVGDHSTVTGAVLGDHTVLTDFTKA